MKTANLKTDLILATITKVAKGPSKWACLWDIQKELKDFPEKIVLSKLKNLLRKGKIQGCTCGCRGDFYII